MTIIFRAKTNEGFIIKVLSELLQNVISTAIFRIHENGIDMRMYDSNELILVDITLQHLNFNIFDFTAENQLYLGINIKHLYKMLKCIKKKDALMLEIDDEIPNSLEIIVFPKENNRISNSSIHIQTIQNLKIIKPSGYANPVIIPSAEYQRAIKDMGVIRSDKDEKDELTISMTKYSLTMSCAIDGLYSKKVTFGEFRDKYDTHYCEQFDMESFNRIVKISGLSQNLKIYSNGYEYPLLIVSNIGSLGTISIYIKSISQRTDDERKRQDKQEDEYCYFVNL